MLVKGNPPRHTVSLYTGSARPTDTYKSRAGTLYIAVLDTPEHHGVTLLDHRNSAGHRALSFGRSQTLESCRTARPHRLWAQGTEPPGRLAVELARELCIGIAYGFTLTAAIRQFRRALCL